MNLKTVVKATLHIASDFGVGYIVGHYASAVVCSASSHPLLKKIAISAATMGLAAVLSTKACEGIDTLVDAVEEGYNLGKDLGNGLVNAVSQEDKSDGRRTEINI